LIRKKIKKYQKYFFLRCRKKKFYKKVKLKKKIKPLLIDFFQFQKKNKKFKRKNLSFKFLYKKFLKRIKKKKIIEKYKEKTIHLYNPKTMNRTYIQKVMSRAF